MAGGAVVDIAELRRFMAQLKAYNDLLKNDKAKLMSALNQIGQSWDDSQRQKFDEGMRRAIQTIDRLSARIEGTQLPYLQKKIQAGERYLGR